MSLTKQMRTLRDAVENLDGSRIVAGKPVIIGITPNAYQLLCDHQQIMRASSVLPASNVSDTDLLTCLDACLAPVKVFVNGDDAKRVIAVDVGIGTKTHVQQAAGLAVEALIHFRQQATGRISRRSFAVPHPDGWDAAGISGLLKGLGLSVRKGADDSSWSAAFQGRNHYHNFSVELHQDAQVVALGVELAALPHPTSPNEADDTLRRAVTRFLLETAGRIKLVRFSLGGQDGGIRTVKAAVLLPLGLLDTRTMQQAVAALSVASDRCRPPLCALSRDVNFARLFLALRMPQKAAQQL